MRRRYACGILLLVLLSCSKSVPSEIANNTAIEGTWQLLSSTVYEINHNTAIIYNRIEGYGGNDSLVFQNNGLCISTAFSFNLWTGTISYAYYPDKQILQLKNSASGISYIDTVKSLTGNQLIITRGTYDTVSRNPLTTVPLLLIDSLYR